MLETVSELEPCKEKNLEPAIFHAFFFFFSNCIDMLLGLFGCIKEIDMVLVLIHNHKLVQSRVAANV